MSHVFLIGFMGAGKSTVGPLVADVLDRPFVDLDERIAREQGRSIADIFEADGEQHFRHLEREAVEALVAEPDAVVACGGGIVTVADTAARLRVLGTVVYLETTVDEALARIGDISSRPLLADAGAAARLLESRREAYEAAADVTVDTVGLEPAAIADEIVVAVARVEANARPEVVKVAAASGSYEVVIGPGVLDDVGVLMRIVADSARNVALITDMNVGHMYALAVERRLVQSGFDVHPLSVAAGEESKNWMLAGELLEALADLRLDRRDVVLALGGGVIGDLAGFVAATYLRGVDFVQVPTTLLAQVDSSVGGKTGVDLQAGKNLAGAFKQPLLVIADTSVLASLPEAEWVSGLAEIAKSAVVDGEEFLGWLESNAEALVEREEAVVREAVRRSVEFKSRVVTADETEAGPRECLNYGHTFGHALEKVSGYGSIPHGIAVAEGMRFAVRLSVEVAGASTDLVRRQDRLLDLLGLPALSVDLRPSDLLEAMHSDKKARGGSVRFVLIEAAGAWRCEPVADRVIGEHVAAWAAARGGSAR